MIDKSLLLSCIATFAVIYMAQLLKIERARKKADAARVNSLEIELKADCARKKAYADRLKSLEIEIETERAAKEALEKQLMYELSSMTVEQWNSLNDHDRRLNEDLCKQYGIPFPNMQKSSDPDSTEQDGERTLC